MTEREKKAKEYLIKIQAGLAQLKNILLERFTNDNSTIQTNHSNVRALIYEFTQTAKPTTKQKVQINKYVRQNIQAFIIDYVQKRLTPIEKITKDPHNFVYALNQIWGHYQVFIFSYFHVCEKLTQFFQGFYKMSNCKDYQYKTAYSQNVNQEVVAIAVMGVNTLKQYFQKITLIQKFKGVFNQFLHFEREGKNVPRSEIRESIHSLQSCYFDMEALVILGEGGKPQIVKGALKLQKIAFRKGRDSQFFNDHLMTETLNNLNKFYTDFVNNIAINLNATEQINKMIEILREQEARAIYYIHSKENRDVYFKNLDNSLIRLKLEARIRKQDGFKKYIQLFQENKQDYAKEIKDLWFVFSRISDDSVKYLKIIFAQYLSVQAQNVYLTTKKPPQYVQLLIRINGKCLKIVQFCANNFELQNERNNKLRGMLSNDITARGRADGKFDIGAKNLASYINNKFKASYAKNGQQSLGVLYSQLVNLFKILQQKTRFIDEYSRFMAVRLLQQIQFSQDLKTSQILALEKSFIEQIQRQCGVAQVKQLIENIKDVEKSIQQNNKMKVKIREQVRQPLKQIIIKNGIFWPQRSTYIVQNPPRQLIKSYNALMDYFKSINRNVLVQFNSGVSQIVGDFLNGKKQRFQLKNLYCIILMFIDEENRILYGNLKKKMEASGVNKQLGVIQMARAVIQLLYSGLIISSTKSIQPGTANICKLSETDQFQINKKYDFIEEEKKKKPKVPPKPVAILKSNIMTLSEELKKGFDQAIKQINDDQKRIEAERKFKVECITVKTLKHAHHHQMNCDFDQLFKVTQEGRSKQFRVTAKYLKEIIQELISKKYCERIEGQRNVFRYIA